MEIVLQVFFFFSVHQKKSLVFSVHLHSTVNSGSILILKFCVLRGDSQVK